MPGKKTRAALAPYRRKRDFRKTPEPPGRQANRRLTRGRRGQPLFVIQQHDARTLHWDFRLEAEGVLKSWVIPRGPSTDPREKRLALATEDHPLEYADFEGVIPTGEYGAGTVIVWDTGTYTNLTRDDDGREVPLARALARGRATIRLEGQKLRGGYALVKRARRGRQKWFFIKLKDEGADARRRPLHTEPRSVRSGRTLGEVAEEEG